MTINYDEQDTQSTCVIALTERQFGDIHN